MLGNYQLDDEEFPKKTNSPTGAALPTPLPSSGSTRTGAALVAPSWVGKGANPSLPDTSETLAATKDAYNKGGFGAALGAYARGTVADAAKYAWDNPITKPIKAINTAVGNGLTNFGSTVVTGDPTPVAGPALTQRVEPTPSRPATTGPALVGVQYGPEVAPKPAGFKSTLSNGITMEGDNQGNRTYTMGTKGQDGYGRMQVHPGTDQPAGNPLAAQPATLDSLKAMGTRMGTTRGSGYSFHGTAADGAAFMEPTGVNANSLAAMKDQFNRMNPEYIPAAKPAPAMEAPKYLGPESGLGWKTRAKIYGDQMDAYNRATGNKTALDVEGMREAGAGSRAALVAQGVMEKNAIDRQQVDQVGQQFREGAALRGTELEAKQLALGDVKQMQALKDTMLKGDPASPEYQKAYQQWSALNGKNENNYGVIDQYDDNGQKTGSALYNRASGVIGGGKGAALQAPPEPPKRRSWWDRYWGPPAK